MKQWLFDEPVEFINKRPVLLDIQRSLLERGREPYAKGAKRVIWQAPCGAGKTIVAGEQTVQALEKNKTVLHIVHRRRLVDQMIKTLGWFGIQATPIMEGRQRWNSKVMCASRDTLLAMLKSGCELPRADLIIPDECHVKATATQDWYLKNCPDSYWCGYTATPINSDGTSMKPPWEALVCMAPHSKMVELGRLCSVKIFNPDQIGQRRRKGEKVNPVGDPVDHWKKYALNLPTIVFAAKVADSKAIVERYKAAGITAEHMDASTSDDDRDAIFERSRLGITKIISNVGVLIEGVDLPWIVCVQILRGCNSLVLFVQATGRCMRFFEGKEFGIILDHSGAAHEFLLSSPTGGVSWDFQWSLDDENTVTKKNKQPKDQRPVTCTACGFVFSGKPACPHCGKVLPKQKRKAMAPIATHVGSGVLTEFNGQQQQNIQAESMERLFKRLYYSARNSGKSMGVVAARFGKEAGIPPWQAGLSFNLPFGKGAWSVLATDWEI